MSEIKKKIFIIISIMTVIVIILEMQLINKDSLVSVNDAQRILNKHRDSLDIIATYLIAKKNHDPVQFICNADWSDGYYKKLVGIPPDIMDVFSDFFIHVAPDGQIYPVEWLLMHYNYIPYTNGVCFQIKSYYYGKDAEGIDVRISQCLIFNDSPNAMNILEHISGLPGKIFAHNLGINPINHLERSWYLVTVDSS